MIFRVTIIFLTVTANCHNRAAIEIHITYFTRIFNDHLIFLKNKGVREWWALGRSILIVGEIIWVVQAYNFGNFDFEI